MIRYIKNKLVFTIMLAVSTSSFAHIKPIATRAVISLDGESQIRVVNSSDTNSFLVQAWLETLDGELNDLPIILMPPLFKMGPSDSGQVRVVPLKKKLPKDRESMFYLSLQEIPQAIKSEGNYLQIAMRTKIKVLVRPEQLNFRDMQEAYEKDLSWSVIQEGDLRYVTVKNNSPYHFSFGKLHLVMSKEGKDSIQLENRIVALPFSTTKYLVPDGVTSRLILVYAYIDDFGGLKGETSIALD